MNEAVSKRVHELCSRIALERDHKKFLTLVQELNRLLAGGGDLEEDAAGQSEC
jgi:hypothetical protein